MRNLNRKIEDWLSAISFAEAGEFETAKEILNENRRILLALKGEQIDQKTLKYTVNTCKRIGANLDILYFSSETDDLILEQFLKELENEGIQHKLVKNKSGFLKQGIIDYANERKEIVFVVIESSDSLDDCKGKHKGFSGLWQNLQCPLVIVMESC
jgi:hypothetical protein